MTRWLGLAVLAATLHATSAFAQTPSEAPEAPPSSEAPEEAAPVPAPPMPAPAGATPLTEADEGVAAYLAKDDALAQTKLEGAYAELPLPSIGVWVARTLARRGRLLDAQTRYRAIVEEPPATTAATLAQARSRGLAPPDGKAQQKAKDEARVELEQVTARIPRITVVAEGAAEGQARITLDRQPDASGQLEPGPLRIEGTYEGQTIVRNIVLNERDRATVRLPFDVAPPPAETSSATPVLGWVLVGVGAAGVAVGGVIAGVAIGKLSSLDCDDNICDESQRDDMDAYNALRLPAGFLIVGGGLVAATGAAVLLTAPDASGGDVALQLGPGYLGLTGSF